MTREYLTTFENRVLLTLRDRFRQLLVDTARHRDRNDEIVTGPDGFPELAWAAHERTVLLGDVNHIRVDHGLPTLGMSVMQRADNLAAGHIDYVDKLAFYCAEMAFDLPPWGQLHAPGRADT